MLAKVVIEGPKSEKPCRRHGNRQSTLQWRNGIEMESGDRRLHQPAL